MYECVYVCVIIIASQSDEEVSEEETAGPQGRGLRGRPKRNIEKDGAKGVLY